MQHLSTKITWFFLRLFIVRILSRAADHAKKASCEGACVHHTFFQGKRLPTEQSKKLKKDPIVNKPFLEETHHSLSSLPLLTMTKCNTWKKEAKTSTS